MLQKYAHTRYITNLIYINPNTNISSEENFIGANFKKNIKSTGRTLFIESSLMLAFRNYYALFGKYDNPTSFRYQGKTIDADRIAFDFGIRQIALAPQIAFTRTLSKWGGLRLYLSYSLPLQTSNVFRIKEDKGKTLVLPADDPSLVFLEVENWKLIY